MGYSGIIKRRILSVYVHLYMYIPWIDFSLQFTVDLGCLAYALISLNGKEICAYRKVCTYKRVVYGTAHFLMLTSMRSRCMSACA